MENEFINYDFAKKILENENVPFRNYYKNHFIKFPKDFIDKSQEIIDSEIASLLGEVGWRFSRVVIAKNDNGEPFYAYLCEPIDLAAWEKSSEVLSIPHGETIGFRDVVFDRLQNVAWEYVASLPSLDTCFHSVSGLPSCRAVYFVVENGIIIYVGKTGNLSKRWGSQHKLKNMIGKIKIYYQVYSDGVSTIDSDEAAFIAIFRPEKNNIIGLISLR
jgi:hypothetical protein